MCVFFFLANLKMARLAVSLKAECIYDFKHSHVFQSFPLLPLKAVSSTYRTIWISAGSPCWCFPANIIIGWIDFFFFNHLPPSCNFILNSVPPNQAKTRMPRMSSTSRYFPISVQQEVIVPAPPPPPRLQVCVCVWGGCSQSFLLVCQTSSSHDKHLPAYPFNPLLAPFIPET